MIDTAQKLGSSLGFDSLDAVLPFPADDLTAQAAWQQQLRDYSGILAIESTTWTQVPRDTSGWAQESRDGSIWTKVTS